MRVFFWQQSTGWAWKVDDGRGDARPDGVGYLLREWAIEAAEEHFGPIGEKIFTSPDGKPSLNA